LQEADALQDAVGRGGLGPADDVVGEHVGVRVGGLRRRRREGVEVFCGVGPNGVGEAGVRVYGCAARGPEVCLGGVELTTVGMTIPRFSFTLRGRLFLGGSKVSSLTLLTPREASPAGG
jgi:hypothetical protein